MLTQVKQLDKKFLNNYYQEMVDEVQDIFEVFLKETTKEINEINDLLNQDNFKCASEILRKITPSFLTIGLPQLTVKLQIIEVYLSFSNLTSAKLLMRAFIKEMEGYMPAIIEEYKRLKR